MINRLLHMIGIGRATLIDDSDVVQRVQLSLGNFPGGERIMDKVPFIGRFGFSSSPPLKAEILFVAIGGDRSQAIAIGSNDQTSRPRQLEPGDAMIYDIRGAHILLKDGRIEIEAKGQEIIVQNATTVTVKASDRVRVEAPYLDCTGDVRADVDGTPASLVGLRTAYNAHHHTGVSTGGGTSGATDHAA